MNQYRNLPTYYFLGFKADVDAALKSFQTDATIEAQECGGFEWIRFVNSDEKDDLIAANSFLAHVRDHFSGKFFVVKDTSPFQATLAESADTFFGTFDVLKEALRGFRRPGVKYTVATYGPIGTVTFDESLKVQFLNYIKEHQFTDIVATVGEVACV